jgi:two-component system, LytTR family, sensor kinase
MLASPWLRLAVAFAAWTTAAVLFTIQSYIGASHSQSPLTWSAAATFALAAWLTRAAASPLVIVMARRLPIEREQRVRRLLLHAALGLPWAGLTTAAVILISARVGAPVPREAWSVELYLTLLTYAALVGLTQGADYLRRRTDRELTSARLEARLATARFDLLRMQLNPHFLTSALHDVSDLMRRDPHRAEEMVEALTELVRLSLRHAGEADVPLSEEVGFLERYLQLERMRSHDRLETHVDIESDVMSARVPYLVLRPLVENAVRHGVAPHVERGRVEVRGRADGEALVLEVYDDRERAASSALCVRLELPLRRRVTSPPSVPIEAHQ